MGSGLGGLSAAGFLGKAGKRVLVVEARDKFGGVAAQFERGPYKFDPAIHIMAVGENFLMWKALRYLQVFDQVEFLNTGGYYDARFPDFSIRLPTGREDYNEALAREFPGHEEAPAGLHRPLPADPPRGPLAPAAPDAERARRGGQAASRRCSSTA